MGALSVFSCVTRLMISPYNLCTYSHSHTCTRLPAETLFPRPTLSHELCSVRADVHRKGVREGEMCTNADSPIHLTLFTHVSQSNGLLVSGAVVEGFSGGA